jgi:2-polyprenyl-3-methyl-5-hydroxy-6-metoxy-1,4-benzoquinol methylase
MTVSALPGALIAPALISATLSAYERTGVLCAAIELDLFTAIAQGANTPPALAARCCASERGMRILADCLVVLGLLDKARGCYRLTAETATFLDRSSQNYIGGLAKFAASAEKFQRYLGDPVAWVRAGGTSEEANTAPENPVWVDYAKGMGPLSARLAEAMADALCARAAPAHHVLDVAAGHGFYGIAVARHNPAARIVAVDWAPVLEVAAANAAAAGVAERYGTRPGDAFTIDFGAGYDLVLVPNFLHHFSTETCVEFLKRAKAALAPGGVVAILEYMPNEDRVSPPQAAWFALTMLANTPQGDAYTVREHEAMCRAAGLAPSGSETLPGSAETMLVATAS